MSRVDEALRRASSDTSGFRAPIAVEPAAVVVDASALERYGVEKGTPHVDKPRRPALAPAPRIAAPAPLAPPAHALREPFTAFHRSLEGKIVSSRETSPVSIEQVPSSRCHAHHGPG